MKSQIDASGERIFKKDILKTEAFNVVIVYLGKNQEIPPHPEDYAVFFFVLEGSGLFTKKETEHSLQKGGCIYYEKNEVRGIASNEKLILLGIQEPH
ncbi:MAG: cupin domain-containing protein [Candidatus Helarchaeota archaeon]